MKYSMLSLIILLTFTSILPAQTLELNRALLVVDVQDHFTSTLMKPEASELFLQNINEVITRMRPDEIIFIQANIRVLSISFRGIRVETIDNIALDGRLCLKKNDLVFMKNKPSAFSVESLNTFLEMNGIRHIVLVGLMAGECIDATALDGLSRAYDISIIEEGVVAKKPGKKWKYLRKLEEAGVKLIKLDDL